MSAFGFVRTAVRKTTMSVVKSSIVPAANTSAALAAQKAAIPDISDRPTHNGVVDFFVTSDVTDFLAAETTDVLAADTIEKTTFLKHLS